MTRSRRRLLAFFGILGIVFAQLVVTAHACALRANAMAPVVGSAHAGHCGGEHAATLPEAPSGNACEVQCTDGAPSATAPDLPAVAFVALIAPQAPATMPVAEREWDHSVLAASGAAPPRTLQYCRLLI
jgi:hypothetical protein